MKRAWGWLWLWVGVLFLLCILHAQRPTEWARAVLARSAFVSTWLTARWGASTAFAWSRAGPRESFALLLRSEFWNAVDVGPPWLDHRGPPGPPGCRHFAVTGCKAAGQAGSQRSEKSTSLPPIPEPPNSKSKTRGFSTAFSSQEARYIVMTKTFLHLHS